jgi:hypothetical protein
MRNAFDQRGQPGLGRTINIVCPPAAISCNGADHHQCAPPLSLEHICGGKSPGSSRIEIDAQNLFGSHKIAFRLALIAENAISEQHLVDTAYLLDKATELRLRILWSREISDRSLNTLRTPDLQIGGNLVKPNLISAHEKDNCAILCVKACRCNRNSRRGSKNNKAQDLPLFKSALFQTDCQNRPIHLTNASPRDSS